MQVKIDPSTGELSGEGITESRRTIGGLRGYFGDEAAYDATDSDQLAYRVQSWMPAPEGEEGAVCLATTFLEPGLVGREYLLTRGHFHAEPDRPELCVTVAGEGALILMDEARVTRIETMRAGSIHHVPVRTAHRCANTGDQPLVFISYWASETGHDYETIAREGFSARLLRIQGASTLVDEADPRD